MYLFFVLLSSCTVGFAQYRATLPYHAVYGLPTLAAPVPSFPVTTYPYQAVRPVSPLQQGNNLLSEETPNAQISGIPTFQSRPIESGTPFRPRPTPSFSPAAGPVFTKPTFSPGAGSAFSPETVPYISPGAGPALRQPSFNQGAPPGFVQTGPAFSPSAGPSFSPGAGPASGQGSLPFFNQGAAPGFDQAGPAFSPSAELTPNRANTGSIQLPQNTQLSIRDDRGQYTHGFNDLQSGTSMSEQGRLISTNGGWEYIIVKEGEYSYTSPEGVPVKVKYIADQDGYRVIN